MSESICLQLYSFLHFLRKLFSLFTSAAEQNPDQAVLNVSSLAEADALMAASSCCVQQARASASSSHDILNRGCVTAAMMNSLSCQQFPNLVSIPRRTLSFPRRILSFSGPVDYRSIFWSFVRNDVKVGRTIFNSTNRHSLHPQTIQYTIAFVLHIAPFDFRVRTEMLNGLIMSFCNVLAASQ